MMYQDTFTYHKMYLWSENIDTTLAQVMMFKVADTSKFRRFYVSARCVVANFTKTDIVKENTSQRKNIEIS